MLTGPEHYLEAEACLEAARVHHVDPVHQDRHLAEAQVHATLALATSEVQSEAWEVFHGRTQP